MKRFPLSVLRDDDNVNRLRSVSEKFTDLDWHRMVAAVEECNAVFEAFYLRDLPGRPSMLVGFPVFYSDEVNEGEAFGGMWSDEKDGKPEHSAAFVRLVVRT